VGRPVATVSVDVDPVDLHLIGYGHRGLPPDSLSYTVALPRLIDAFARAGIRATLFVVARDAAAHSGVLRALVADGHEVASHSMTHPLALASLEEDRLREELMDSRNVLEAACGERMVGFRSPNYDMDGRTLRRLEAAGYRYDASAYPTPFLLPARLLLAFKSADPAAIFNLKLWPFTWRRTPYRTRGLMEFPVSVTPLIRFPFYHTARYIMSEARFLKLLEGFVRRAEPLSYVVHAVDALGLTEDKVDARLAPHPGMERPLKEKLEILDRSLAAISAAFETLPFRDRLDAIPGSPLP